MDTSPRNRLWPDWARVPVTGREAQRFLEGLSRCDWADLESMATSEGRNVGDFLTYLAVRADSAVWNPDLDPGQEGLLAVLERIAQLISIRVGMDAELREGIAFFWETVADAGRFARDMPERESLIRELLAIELSQSVDSDAARVWVRAERALDAWSRPR